MAAGGALKVREYGRANLRGVWTLAWRGLGRHLGMWVEGLGGPVVSNLLFLTVLVLARDATMGGTWPGIDTASFVAPGLVAFAVCHTAFETLASHMVYDKLERMIQDLLSAPLTAAELLAGWVLGAALCGLASGGAVLLAVLPFVEWLAFDPLRMIGFALLGSLLFALLGLLVGLWARKWDHYAAVETLLLLPFGLLSGTFFLRENLPPLAGDLLYANPVFHVIDGFRGGLLGRSDGEPLVSAAILVVLILLMTLVAWRLVLRGWHLKP
jgi:ABC-2 type transport system permease protein